MSPLRAGGQDQCLLDVLKQITELENEKKELKKKIDAFENDRTRKDEASMLSYIEDKKFLNLLYTRLAELKAEKKALKATTYATSQQAGK
jgi:hypothetical protein